MLNRAPCKGNSLIIRLLPLQGVGLVWRIFTQGAALGYVLLPLRGVLFMSFDTPSTKQEVVLPQKAQNRFTQKFIAEKSLPQMAQIYTEVMVL